MLTGSVLWLKNGILGYGMSYRFAKDRDFQTYDKVTGDIPTENTDSRLREQTANVYVSLSKNYATGTSVSISATGEYYTIGNYRKWAVYPQASLTYVKSSEHLSSFRYRRIRLIRGIGICSLPSVI